MKRLTRSKKDRKLLGILGGLGDYLGVDPTVIRLVFLGLLFLTGVVPLLLAYFVAYLVIPERGEA